MGNREWGVGNRGQGPGDRCLRSMRVGKQFCLQSSIPTPYSLLPIPYKLRAAFALLLAVFAFLSAAMPVCAQESQINFDVSGSVDWTRAELYTQVSFDLARSGIKLPSGRYLAEETLNEAYPGLLRPFIRSVQVDSASTIKDLMDRGELSLEYLDRFTGEAVKTPPSLSADLTRMIGRYTVPLERISSILNRHSSIAEPLQPLVPVQTANYSGVIIIVDEELPVYGRSGRARAEPCLSPKIWDTNMNLVYNRDMTDPSRGGSALIVRYAVRNSIFRPTPSGLEGDLAAFLGNNPLRIIARSVFGVHPTDPVIDRNDALKILSTENNRRLLREGRVLLVLNEKMLK